MKLKKLRKISLIIFSALVFAGCKTGPKKPQVQLCVVDVKSGNCFCATTDTEAFESSDTLTHEAATQLIKSGGDVEPYPIQYCHKAIAIRGQHWLTLQNYIHDLENFIKYQCK